MPTLWIAVVLTVLGAGSFLLWRVFRVGTLLPTLARGLEARGKHPAAIQLCEKGLLGWVPGGERTRFDLRFFLAFLYLHAHRYEDAEAQCRVLVNAKLPAPLKAKAKRRLSDALEGQGRHDLAKVLRSHLQESLDHNTTPDALAERARLLTKQNQYAEALALFDKCLAAIPTTNPTRPSIEVERGLAAWNAGRYEEALQSCEGALRQGGLSPSLTRVAHNIAAISLSSLSRLDEAITHKEKVLALDHESGNADKRAESLAQLASLRLQLGQLNEAMRLVQEAIPLSLSGRRQACLVEAEVLTAWGRYDEALDACQRAAKAPGHGLPQQEARSQATLCLAQARLYNSKGEGQTARALLEKTTAFAGDAKLTAWVEAERVLALAHTGPTDTYDAARDALAIPEGDPTTQRTVLSRLAEAAVAQKDFPRALQHLEAYRALFPPPVDLPKVWYFIGEAQQALGNPAAARAAWENALALGIETVWASAAKKRLVDHNVS